MKRKDFLRRMRNRRRGDQVELREPEQRRKIDWRTLRVDLPAQGSAQQAIAVGNVELVASGVRLTPEQPCWVRGYRYWTEEDGRARAEFQYRPDPDESAAPPGAMSLTVGEVWEPAAA